MVFCVFLKKKEALYFLIMVTCFVWSATIIGFTTTYFWFTTFIFTTTTWFTSFVGVTCACIYVFCFAVFICILASDDSCGTFFICPACTGCFGICFCSCITTWCWFSSYSWTYAFRASWWCSCFWPLWVCITATRFTSFVGVATAVWIFTWIIFFACNVLGTTAVFVFWPFFYVDCFCYGITVSCFIVTYSSITYLFYYFCICYG